MLQKIEKVLEDAQKKIQTLERKDKEKDIQQIKESHEEQTKRLKESHEKQTKELKETIEDLLQKLS